MLLSMNREFRLFFKRRKKRILQILVFRTYYLKQGLLTKLTKRKIKKITCNVNFICKILKLMKETFENNVEINFEVHINFENLDKKKEYFPLCCTAYVWASLQVQF